MAVRIREYEQADAKTASEIWDQVVEDGNAFPQTELLTEKTGRKLKAEHVFMK